MLKSLFIYLYVEDELAEYVPDEPHGRPRDLHSRESGVLSHRSLLPVSRCSRTV